jgi:hypothetical protein
VRVSSSTDDEEVGETNEEDIGHNVVRILGLGREVPRPLLEEGKARDLEEVRDVEVRGEGESYLKEAEDHEDQAGRETRVNEEGEETTDARTLFQYRSP